MKADRLFFVAPCAHVLVVDLKPDETLSRFVVCAILDLTFPRASTIYLDRFCWHVPVRDRFRLASLDDIPENIPGVWMAPHLRDG